MKRIHVRVVLLLFTLAPLVVSSCTRCSLPLGTQGGRTYTVAAYNVGALFDAVDDGVEYDGYSVAGGTWSADMYAERLRRVAEVITAAAKNGPDVVALEELENPAVLSELNRCYLGKSGYRYEVMSPCPGAAINCGLLSRWPVLSTRAHAVSEGGDGRERNILETTLNSGHGSLVVFVNHWKSKLGGAEATEPARMEAASVIRRRTAAILADDPRARILVVGDLNENADESDRVGRRYGTALLPFDPSGATAAVGTGGSVRALLLSGSRDSAASWPAGVFYEPWTELGGTGSYWRSGGWETIDHILLSPSFLGADGLRYAGFEAVSVPFLLNARGHPAAWDGSRWEGYSDHLPVLVRLAAAE